MVGKKLPALVADGKDHHNCKRSAFTSWWKEKTQPAQVAGVQEDWVPALVQFGAGCSSSRLAQSKLPCQCASAAASLTAVAPGNMYFLIQYMLKDKACVFYMHVHDLVLRGKYLKLG